MTRFDSAVSSAVELKPVATGNLPVLPRGNGKHIGWFILDSRAGELAISPKAAVAAKMPAFGAVACHRRYTPNARMGSAATGSCGPPYSPLNNDANR